MDTLLVKGEVRTSWSFLTLIHLGNRLLTLCKCSKVRAGISYYEIYDSEITTRQCLADLLKFFCYKTCVNLPFSSLILYLKIHDSKTLLFFTVFVFGLSETKDTKNIVCKRIF